MQINIYEQKLDNVKYVESYTFVKTPCVHFSSNSTEMYLDSFLVTLNWISAKELKKLFEILFDKKAVNIVADRTEKRHIFNFKRILNV